MKTKTKQTTRLRQQVEQDAKATDVPASPALATDLDGIEQAERMELDRRRKEELARLGEVAKYD